MSSLEQQSSDAAKFCCNMDEVFYTDTTFNLCEYQLTDTCYGNLKLETKEGKNPIFIGPSIIHFERDEFLFNRFISEMCSFQPKIRSLKTIDTDQDNAIYNGFSSQIPELNLLLRVLHLEKGEKSKLLQLNPKKGAIQRILADIYRCHYGAIKEYGLADSIEKGDFEVRLELLRSIWETLCPGFYEWFSRKRKHLFQSSVIESARKQTNVQGLFYNNNIESQHFREKNEQCFKKGNVLEVISTLKSLVRRQEDDKIKAIYGSGPYRLSQPFKKFAIDPIKWHNMNLQKRIKHVEQFRKYNPKLEDHFVKPALSGRKVHERKRVRKSEAEIIVNYC